MSAPNPSTPEATRTATKLMRDVTLDGVVVITEADDPHRNWFGEVSDAEEYWSVDERFAHADLIVRAVNSYDDMLDALKAAEVHIAELREAWQRGCISEHDGQGGTRSNRNADTRTQIRKAIALVEAQ